MSVRDDKAMQALNVRQYVGAHHAAGWSQDDLAKLLGVTPGRFSDLLASAGLDEDGRCRHCRRTPEQCGATGCGGRHEPYSAPWSNPKPETTPDDLRAETLREAARAIELDADGEIGVYAMGKRDAATRLREMADGTAPGKDSPAEDEWVRCSGLHCPNAERFAKVAERGWQPGGMGTWQCPDCATSTATPGAES